MSGPFAMVDLFDLFGIVAPRASSSSFEDDGAAICVDAAMMVDADDDDDDGPPGADADEAVIGADAVTDDAPDDALEEGGRGGFPEEKG